MATINSYLNFEGKTEEAFNFYKSVFGGEFLVFQRYKDIPDGDEMSTEDLEKIMHVSLTIGTGSVLMGTDALQSMGHSVTFGNNISLSVNADSEQEAKQVFDGLAQGGQVTMPQEKTFWNAYFGMLTDKFGINWMVNYDYGQD